MGWGCRTKLSGSSKRIKTAISSLMLVESSLVQHHSATLAYHQTTAFNLPLNERIIPVSLCDVFEKIRVITAAFPTPTLT